MIQTMPWDQSDANVLLEAVARASTDASSESAVGKLQDFEHAAEYFTEQHWDFFLDTNASSESKLHHLLQHTAALGLRFPSETTVQKLVALYLAVTHGCDNATKIATQVKYDTVQFFKKKVKEFRKSQDFATYQAWLWLLVGMYLKHRIYHQMPIDKIYDDNSRI